MPSVSAFVSVPVKSCHYHVTLLVRSATRDSLMLIRSIVSNSSRLAICAMSWPDPNHKRFSSAVGDQSLSFADQRGTDSVLCALRGFVFQRLLIVERIMRYARRIRYWTGRCPQFIE